MQYYLRVDIFIMLSEINQRKANTIWYHLHVESKKYKKLVNKIKNKMVFVSCSVKSHWSHEKIKK